MSTNVVSHDTHLTCVSPVHLPINSGVLVSTTSVDVIHAWTVPLLFVKVDSVPGRLNTSYTNFNSIISVMYGQCSELCGSGHAHMPITVVCC